MTPLLFVYGTLRFDCAGDLGRVQRANLRQQSALIATATTRGRLLNLGRYPGLTEGSGRVHGLFLRLHQPAKTLAWLDAYEDCTGRPDDEYRRVLRSVVTADGSARMAWVYVLARVPVDAIGLPTGVWTG